MATYGFYQNLISKAVSKNKGRGLSKLSITIKVLPALEATRGLGLVALAKTIKLMN